MWKHVLRVYRLVNQKQIENDPVDLDLFYGVHVIPTKILIDPDGKIIGRFGDRLGGSVKDMD